MSFINPVIETNKLINELNDIAYFVGYKTRIIPVNGAIVFNDNTAVSTVNNTQYGYSTNNFLESWIAQATPILNTNCFIGVSQNINQVFAGASSVSMQMVDYGVIIDNQSNNVLTIFLIKNGAINFTPTITNANQVAPVKMAYSEGSINFYIDNVIQTGFAQTGLALENCSLIVGGFVGGTLQNIIWTGSDSGGINQNLKDVLTTGNDGGGNAINNVSTVAVTSNVTVPVINGTNNNLQFCSDSTKTKALSIQTITSVASPFFGDPYISLSNQANTKTSRVYDTLFNSPETNYYFDYTNIGPTTKIYPAAGKSIMAFKLQKPYQSFTCNLTKLIFDIDNQGTGGKPIFVQFYLTTIIDGSFGDYTGSFTTDDLNTDGNFTNFDNIILTYYNATNTVNDILYLNAYIANNNSGNYDFNNIQVAGQIVANSLPQVSINPSLITP